MDITEMLLEASTAWPDPYDFMGFQECDDIERVVHDSGPLGRGVLFDAVST